VLKKICVGVAFMTVACAAPRASQTAADAPRPPFDATRLRRGHFAYSTELSGVDAGTSNITVEQTNARSFRFHNEVTGAFRQTWEAIATPELEPLAATLGLGANDDHGRTMRLLYGEAHVHGTATHGPVQTEVSASLPRDVVDQRIDWAAIMSLPLDVPGLARFEVYDPWTGVSPVSATIGERENVSVPAGTFTAIRVIYRIEKGERTERYTIWVADPPPRFLVREDFPDGSTTKLVAAGK
jgi:hypothetical protein